MEQVRLQTLIAEMARALQETQIMMEQAKLEHFLSYFTETDNLNQPRTMDMVVGISECGERKEGKLSVPIATLISHRGLAMDTVEVRINTALTSAGDGLMAQVGDIERKENAEDGNVGSQCEIKLVFRNEDPADGIQETNNLLRKSI